MPSSTRCRPPVAATAFRNAQRNSDRQNARIEHDKALAARDDRCDARRHRAIQAVHGQRQLKRWMTDTVLSLTYEPARTP